MVKIAGVRFDKEGIVYFFRSDTIEVRKEDCCIVEEEDGEKLGTVVMGTMSAAKACIVEALPSIVRLATDTDRENFNKLQERERKAFDFCQKRILQRDLPMKLVKVKYINNGEKVIFYFRAEGRVDFRDLVKDLAQRFRVRIELKQIGVRDEAKVLQGFGPCGRPFCCASFLKEFCPISIRMAKKQNMILNPSKISGVCGKLMCCLSYENREE
ncbi:stage 0 sporulation protein [bacterium (candidate division B38) B3_B38]|nr:MAG: stage 0 sporulation protein [bacterium (candidate division B38) B3_B38]